MCVFQIVGLVSMAGGIAGWVHLRRVIRAEQLTPFTPARPGIDAQVDAFRAELDAFEEAQR